MSDTIGIIGLGNAGSALARALAREFPLVGYDVKRERAEAVAGIALDWVDSVEAVADVADVALLSLPRPDASRTVVAEIANAPSTVRLVIETSTITPKVARELAATCREAGIGFVDAAIAGGVQAMAAGQNTFLAGGSEADFAQARKVLDPIAARIHWLGPVGAGSGAKVVNNAVMHAVMVVLIEAGAMASKLDIPMRTMIEILARPDGLMRPLEHRMGERMLAENYTAGMSVTNARKDSVLALETAQDFGVPLFATLAAHTPYEIAEQLGYGDLDYAALAKLWETWCDISFAESADGD
ncbi:MAG: NAD(P)-dependent oxidoreductase [Gammaproteobacteria bacterium]|nr:NAD(P)-dependent oxidoreductase [Gammaproteobacteria bacterium]